MAFVPFLLVPSPHSSIDGALKYFLSQTLASVFCLLGLLAPYFLREDFLLPLLLNCGLLVKLGAAPFHAWLPRMRSFLSWDAFLVLLTVQKLNPLLLLIVFLPLSSPLLLAVAVASLVLGSVVGLFQTQTRRLLVYSSVNQAGWFLMALHTAGQLVLLIFCLYVVVLLPVVFLLKRLQINTLAQCTSKKVSAQAQVLLFLSLLSLGGLPPFLGFLPK